MSGKKRKQIEEKGEKLNEQQVVNSNGDLQKINLPEGILEASSIQRKKENSRVLRSLIKGNKYLSKVESLPKKNFNVKIQFEDNGTAVRSVECTCDSIKSKKVVNRLRWCEHIVMAIKDFGSENMVKFKELEKKLDSYSKKELRDILCSVLSKEGPFTSVLEEVEAKGFSNDFQETDELIEKNDQAIENFRYWTNPLNEAISKYEDGHIDHNWDKECDCADCDCCDGYNYGNGCRDCEHCMEERIVTCRDFQPVADLVLSQISEGIEYLEVPQNAAAIDGLRIIGAILKIFLQIELFEDDDCMDGFEEAEKYNQEAAETIFTETVETIDKMLIPLITDSIKNLKSERSDTARGIETEMRSLYDIIHDRNQETEMEIEELLENFLTLGKIDPQPVCKKTKPTLKEPEVIVIE